MTTRLQNFVNGEFVDAKGGRTPTSSTRAPARPTPRPRCRAAEDVDAAFAAAAAAFEAWRDATPASAAGAAAQDRRRGRGAGRGDRRRPSAATPASRSRSTWREERRPSRRRAPVLRRRGPHAGGPLGRGVPGRPHLVRPARADRRCAPGHAVELPDDDGGLEVRPGDRGRQHGRAQAVRHHPGHHAAAGRDRRPSSCRPACSTWSAATATPAAPWSQPPDAAAWSSITGSVRARAWRSPAAAADDLKRVHLELGGKAPVVVFDDADDRARPRPASPAPGYFNAGQDCTARHPGAGPGRACTTTSCAALAEAAARHRDRRPRRRGRAATAR